jgi:hypothetical protein
MMEDKRDAGCAPGHPDVEKPPVRQDYRFSGRIRHLGYPATRAEDASGLSGTY